MELFDILKNDLLAEKISHAYLFVGSHNRTKEAVLQFAKLLEINPLDLTEVEPLQESGKKGEIKASEIKTLLHETSLSPHGKYRLGVIYQAEKLNTASGNVLLKSLEEPAKNTIYILTAINTLILPTIVSRCRVLQAGFDTESADAIGEKLIKLSLSEAFKEIESAVKNSETDQVLAGLESFLRKMMLAKKDLAVAEKIEYLEETRKRIAGNANQRLALECLILKIKG
jgi:DNA polymerase III gamma/tau subunit